MVKPFDIVDLEKRLVDQGKPELKAVASIVATAVLGWLEESLALEAATQPLFAIGVPVIEALKPVIFAEINKISP